MTAKTQRLKTILKIMMLLVKMSPKIYIKSLKEQNKKEKSLTKKTKKLKKLKKGKVGKTRLIPKL